MKQTGQRAINPEQHALSEVLRDRRLRPADDIYTSGNQSSTRMLHLVEDYQSGRLLIPAHQRERSWPDEKVQEYIEGICRDAAPPGALEFYTVVTGEREGPTFLNDGVQRLLAAKELLDNPEKFGLSRDEAVEVLYATQYPIRSKKHRSHTEALKRFHQVNSNIPLTPFQLTRGVILYCTGDQHVDQWKTILDRLINIVDRAIIRITFRHQEYNPKTQLELLHKSWRQSTSMFWRYLSEDKYGYNWGVDRSEVDFGGGFFEMEMAEYFAKEGPSGIEEELTKFERLIGNESCLISAAWKSTPWAAQGKGMQPATARWLLDVGVFRRNGDVPVPPWDKFIRTLLNYNRGATEVPFTNHEGQQKRVALSFGRVRAVLQVCDIIGCPEFGEWFSAKGRRKKPAEVLPTGMHWSHVEPFCKNGNGKVVAEPALLNLSRQDEPMLEPVDN